MVRFMLTFRGHCFALYNSHVRYAGPITLTRKLGKMYANIKLLLT